MRANSHKERGAALVVVMVTMVALLGMGSLTILSVQSEIASSGNSKFSETALYAAESGAAAAMEFMRGNCSSTSQFSDWVNPNNQNPIMPVGILGNNAPSGSAQNIFAPETKAWYQVYVLNNTSDPGLAAGNDTDGIIVLQVYGYGPNQSQALLEISIQSASCVKLPSWDFAQQGITSLNDSNAASSSRIDSTGMRTFQLGSP